MPTRNDRMETVDALSQALVEGKVRVTDFENIYTYGALMHTSDEKIRFIVKNWKKVQKYLSIN